MKKKRSTQHAVPPLRSFSLHARFTPDGPEPNDASAFRDFYLDAKARTQTLQAKDLKRRETRLKTLKDVERKAQPILRAFLRDEISPDEAVAKIKSLVPDKALAAELLDHWKMAVEATPESVAEGAEKIVCDEADLHRRTQLGKVDRTLHSSLWRLSEAAMSGDVDAAESLADAAISASAFLQMAERAHPEVFSRIARMRLSWPVLAPDEVGWEKSAARRVVSLELGADLQIFKVRFRSPRGTDANLPARLWAKAAVRVAEETRWRVFMLSQLTRDFGCSGDFADFCLDSEWSIARETKWGSTAATLPPFSQGSLPKWKPLVRQMIREEMPVFHLEPEWVNQRRTAEAAGRNSVGEIQNAILDDIVSALTKLAP